MNVYNRSNGPLIFIIVVDIAMHIYNNYKKLYDIKHEFDGVYKWLAGSSCSSILIGQMKRGVWIDNFSVKS